MDKNNNKSITVGKIVLVDIFTYFYVINKFLNISNKKN